MKLTRQQEELLINLGLQTLFNRVDRSEINSLNRTGKRGPYKKKFVPWNKGLKTGKNVKYKWSTERRKKFSETMKKKWANKA